MYERTINKRNSKTTMNPIDKYVLHKMMNIRQSNEKKSDMTHII